MVRGFFAGMDIAQVRALARQMRTEAADIERQLTVLTAQIEGAPWKGADRDRYCNTWRDQHSVALRNVIDSLRRAATEASVHADQQERVSGSR